MEGIGCTLQASAVIAVMATGCNWIYILQMSLSLRCPTDAQIPTKFEHNLAIQKIGKPSTTIGEGGARGG